MCDRVTAGTDFDGVQRVTGEDQADPSKAPRKEVLQGADRLRLRLLGHLHSAVSRKTTNTRVQEQKTTELKD